MAGTELAVIADDEVINRFMVQADAAKNMWLEALDTDDSMRIAFAESRSRRLLLQSLADPHIAAEMLAFCDPRLGMVEIINTVSDQDKIRIVAMGILNGFAPGTDEFGIFGGRNPKLYIKENGYRVLFSRLSKCSAPDVSVGHPEWSTLGATKNVWLVDGEASCVRDGVKHHVLMVDRYRIGIPGQPTDNIDAIKAKARRRLLQQLWKKVSSANLQDSEDGFEDVPSVTVVEPETKAIPKHTSTPPASDVWAAEAGRIEAPRAKDAWAALVQAATPKRIDEIMEGVKKIDATARDRESLERFAMHRLEALSR